jgi:shikimate kinase
MWLVGMMGSRKSTVGAAVATDVVDTSDLTADETVRHVVELWPY